MDVLDSESPPAARRRRVPLPALVGAALVALGVAQASAVGRTPPLPEDVALTVPQENYFFSETDAGSTVQFELRNTGERAVRVEDVTTDVPGLSLVDVAAAGEPLGFRSVGEGPQPLPGFPLGRGESVVVTLVLRADDCAAVPEQDQPVAVRVSAGRAEGRLPLALPPLPDDRAGAGAEDEVAWQVVLVRGMCS